MPRRRTLLTLAHSYAVGLNRRLAHEMARVGKDSWEVTALAPSYFHGTRDLRPVALQTMADEPCALKIVPAYLTSRIHLFFYGWALRSILSAGWDLVHCWEEPYILVGAQVAWWTPRQTALVYATFQNLPKSYPPPFNWMERYCLKRSAGWIAFGKTIVENLGARPGYRDRPTRTIAPGVDTVRFAPDPARGGMTRTSLNWTPAGPPVVGFLGRFIPDKGLELLLRVLDSLKTPWRALFVGAGPMEAQLKSWAQRRPDQVRVCTGVTHDAVPQYLNAMDILCAPSQTMPSWREQFGRMLVEAFACGVAVVGSDSGEIPYVIGDGGLVVGEKDEAGWQRVLSTLLENSQERGRLARAGRERAEAHFAWPIIAAKHLEFFEQLLEQHPRH